MEDKKRAGHLTNAKLRISHESRCAVAQGLLKEDTRGTHFTGMPRNFSGRNIQTSMIERIEYVKEADTSVIYTMNSIYFAQGNLLEEYIGLGVKFAEGIEGIYEAILAYMPIISPNPESTLKLTQDGADMVGHELGALISPAPSFEKHPLCDRNEYPFSLSIHKGTEKLKEVFFLKAPEFEYV